MRPSALPGRRLATAVAGLRKASELFKHSSRNNDSYNTPYVCGVFHESFVHSRYKRLKSNRGLRASRSRRCPIMAPATMAGPTKGKEACLGTLCEV